MFNEDNKKTIIEKIDDKIKELEDMRGELTDTNNHISFDVLEKEDAKKPKLIKFMTGINEIDREMGGFVEGSFCNLAGESYGGKSTLLLHILLNMSEYSKTLFFNLEMFDRLLVQKIKAFKPTQNQAKNLIIDSSTHKLEEIETKIKRFAEQGVKFFGIDSKMKIQIDMKADEYKKVSEISLRLSKLTQKLGIIIILINQISTEDIKSKRLALKGSGDQVYDSDVIMYVMVDKHNQRTLRCIKDRYSGKSWSIPLPAPAHIQASKCITYEYKS